MCFFKDQVDKEITTQAQPSLSLGQVGSFEIALPSLQDQRKLSKPIQEVSETVSAKRRKLGQLAYLKKALMNDLLTGKVRVKV